MLLKEILEKIAGDREPVLLSDSNKDWEASSLLKNLSVPMLKKQVFFQPGMYIALINEGGYLGEVLYRVKQKT